MARILILIVLVLLIYYVMKHLAAKANQTSQPAAKPAEKIVQCSACGLHVPQSESHSHENLIYCNNPACNPQKPHGD